MKSTRSNEKWFGVLLAVVISAISLVIYSAIVESGLIYPNIWFGIMLPLAIVIANVYLIISGNIRKPQVKSWIVAVWGMLLMSISPLFSLLGILVFPAGFLLLVLGIRITFRHK